jgi:hypothetical protein
MYCILEGKYNTFLFNSSSYLISHPLGFSSGRQNIASGALFWAMHLDLPFSGLFLRM